ncbi:ribosome maturation factor RimM [Clostridium cadaveris]|uniref:ribosome maturation factor RimM n=1 Tax=Clostridium cadaveris TaxID=1529 RepID=UPI000C08A43F|nr:ribosome maturation factor RimM [Clostridium cadaveris]NWK11739.1 16S rRNA processing protein RimM [Clostridium cadaveris]
MKEYMTVGQITKPHGVRGEVKVYPLTDDVRRFRKLKSCIIDDKVVEITWCKLQADRVILKLQGVDTVEDAERMRNKYIKVERKDAVKLPRNSYFIIDLIGCKVYDSEERYIGELTDVIKTGSNDVYEVKGEKEILIPALKEIVYSVDVEEKKIIIKPVGEWQDED